MILDKTDILIIDDEQVIIDAIKKIAKYKSFTVDATLDAKEAIKKLDGTTYRLIICDIMMPGMSGFEFLEIVNKRKIATPVLMTTGFSTLENAVKALYEGAMGFIPKPFTVDELTSIMHRGMVYRKLFENKYNPGAAKNNELLSFVSCPPNYHRLGFDSWINEDIEGTVKIGLTDLFLKSIGALNSVDLMNIEQSVYQGGSCIKILDSEENTHQMLSPISGKILSINEKILDNVNLLEKDPYFEGWIYSVVPDDLETEIENLIPCSSDINGFQVTIEKFVQ